MATISPSPFVTQAVLQRYPQDYDYSVQPYSGANGWPSLHSSIRKLRWGQPSLTFALDMKSTGHTLLGILLVLVAGCATRQGRVIVACGNLVSHHDEGGLGVARYHVSEVLRGTLPKTPVSVVFRNKLQTSGLPTRAILVVSAKRMNPYSCYSVGEDSRRGILPDTPANREQVASTSDARLLDNPRRLWLPKSRAEQIVRDRLRSEGANFERVHLKLRRGEFGWKGLAEFSNAQGEVSIGSELYTTITDAGEILRWERGM